jgi:hypothetical protein
VFASKFVGADDIIEAVKDAEPDDRHLQDVDLDAIDDADVHRVRKVAWVGHAGFLVQIPASHVLFMDGNQWNFAHAAAIYEGIGAGRDVLEVPAARVYRIDAARVKLSQKYARDGVLEEQMGMLEPWTRADIGAYYAQLVDGNHRAAAALAANEPAIYVYVGENYRADVRKKDYE